MSRSLPGWQAYERLVARMMADQLQTEYCVTPNAGVSGQITRRRRQIDVLIELRHDSDNSRRIIVDAKRRRRRITVNDVEAFEGLMKDVGATHGFLVCPHGHTETAERRAQSAISIRLVPLDRLDGFDPSTWPSCQGPHCRRGRVFWDGYPEMRLTLRKLTDTTGDALVSVAFVHYVGKCDRCGRFHVKCVTCERIRSVPDRDPEDCGHQCECRPPWFWLASIEDDGLGNQSAELHVVRLSGEVNTVDRRSL